MTETQKSYRQIVKATSIFGSVQVFKIIISIIRSKFIAVLLGPTGMGIYGLLNSTINLISGFTNFGLGASAVKNIAEAYSTQNETRITTVVTVLRRWVWVTGLLGTLLTLSLAPLLSKITFGNREYALAFIWISITLLLVQLNTGQLAILQGMRKLQYLAKANLAGSISGLIITVPLYYFWGIDAIVPAIIISSIISLVFSWYFSSQLKYSSVRISVVRTFSEGKSMLTVGFMISLSSLITIGASFILRIFISNKGGVAEVGLYNAGFAIISSYVGLIFTAMGTDYYPRLSAIAQNDVLNKQLINQQAEVAVLILAPIIMIFLVYIKYVVIILYSNKFLAINDMIHWAVLGIFFKAASWSIGFIFLAKGAGNLFFWNELFASLYMLALNILGYYFIGLTGLGISFLIGYSIHLVQVFIVCKIKYSFTFSHEFIQLLIIQLLLAIICFIIIQFINNLYSYILGSILILISSYYSFYELDKRIGLKQVICGFFNKKIV